MGIGNRQRLGQAHQHAFTRGKIGFARDRQGQRLRRHRHAACAHRQRTGQHQLRLPEFLFDPSGHAHHVAGARRGAWRINKQAFRHAGPVQALRVRGLQEEAAQAAIAAEGRGDDCLYLHHAARERRRRRGTLDLGDRRRRRAAWLRCSMRARQAGQGEGGQDGPGEVALAQGHSHGVIGR
ncbi:hypothetical protein D3C72_1419020 [compost metagenome]